MLCSHYAPYAQQAVVISFAHAEERAFSGPRGCAWPVLFAGNKISRSLDGYVILCAYFSAVTRVTRVQRAGASRLAPAHGNYGGIFPSGKNPSLDQPHIGADLKESSDYSEKAHLRHRGVNDGGASHDRRLQLGIFGG